MKKHRCEFRILNDPNQVYAEDKFLFYCIYCLKLVHKDVPGAEEYRNKIKPITPIGDAIKAGYLE